MYTIYVKFTCLPEKRAAFIEKVKETGVLEAIRGEDGCIRYDYYLSEKDPNELLLIEQWTSKEHQQIHIGQPHMDTLRGFKGAYITDTVLGEVDLKYAYRICLELFRKTRKFLLDKQRSVLYNDKADFGDRRNCSNMAA